MPFYISKVGHYILPLQVLNLLTPCRQWQVKTD
jgi:hypothetical protein